MRKLIIIWIVAVLAMIYLSLFSYSSEGYGYPGYRGYYGGPSFWYFGGPHYYPNRSLRRGSLGGPGARGGGVHFGK